MNFIKEMTNFVSRSLLFLNVGTLLAILTCCSSDIEYDYETDTNVQTYARRKVNPNPTENTPTPYTYQLRAGSMEFSFAKAWSSCQVEVEWGDGTFPSNGYLSPSFKSLSPSCIHALKTSQTEVSRRSWIHYNNCNVSIQNGPNGPQIRCDVDWECIVKYTIGGDTITAHDYGPVYQTKDIPDEYLMPGSDNSDFNIQ